MVKVEEISERLIRMEEQIKTLFNQQAVIKDLTETVHKLALSIEKQSMSLQTTDKKVVGVKKDVDELRQRPAKRWETVVTGVISALVGAFMAYLLAKGG